MYVFDVYTCVHVCLPVYKPCVCVGVPAGGGWRLVLSIFLSHSALYSPTQSLLLNPELTASVTSQLALEIPCVCMQRAQVTDLLLDSPCFMHVPGTRTLFSHLQGSVLSTMFLPNHTRSLYTVVHQRWPLFFWPIDYSSCALNINCRKEDKKR